MSLLSAIQTSAGALRTFSEALSADQKNVANSATPGYAALRAVILPVGSNSLGVSDQVVLSSSGDLGSDSQVRESQSNSGASLATTARLAQINQLFDITGDSGVLAALQGFSAAFSNVSISPNDPTLRSIALSSAAEVSKAFNAVAASLDAQQTQLGSQTAATVAQINSIGRKIGSINSQVLRNARFDPNLDAQLRSSLDDLSALVPIQVSSTAAGTLAVLVGGRLPLVEGDQSFAISVNTSAPEGSQLSSSGGGSSPVPVSGQLGALVEAGNQSIASIIGGNGKIGSLNVLAKGFAARVNTLLTSGVTPSGSVGTSLYTYDQGNDANVARTLGIDPSVTSDRLGLASSGVGGQSNGVANQLAQLAGSTHPPDQIAGLSAQDYFASIASGIGQKYADAKQQSSSDESAVTEAVANRKAVSGVSLDQEAVNITALQRAYQAAAKIVSVLDQLTTDEVNLIK